MKDVLNACQVDALLPSEELDHANPSDVIFRIAPAVGGGPLRLDQVLALVNHQGAGVEVEDLAGDAGREYGPPGGTRGGPVRAWPGHGRGMGGIGAGWVRR